MIRIASRSKYNAKKVTIDNIIFDSGDEGERYRELKLLLAAKEIEKLKVHPTFPIMVNHHHICTYEADFFYIEPPGSMTFIVEDKKGYMTRDAKLKLKLFEAIYGDDYTLRLT